MGFCATVTLPPPTPPWKGGENDLYCHFYSGAKSMRKIVFSLILLGGCSSQGKVEVPKDAKPAPTEMPKVRNAGEGFKPGN